MWCRFISKATFSLVPTPSTLETSTGSANFLVDRKQPAEAADLAEHAAVESLVRQILDALLGAIGALDVDAGIGVGNGARFCLLSQELGSVSEGAPPQNLFAEDSL